MKGNRTLILIVVWLLVMVSVVASSVTLLASGSGSIGKHWVSSEEYAMLQRYARLEEVRSTLSEKYYQEVDDETLMTGALKGMMASLQDEYTFYYTPEEMADQQSRTQGVYSGVGLLIQGNDAGYIEILRVYRNGPADQAGLRAGDLIVALDGEEVHAGSAEELNAALRLMEGEDGTQVHVTVLREDVEQEITLTRAKVTVNNVTCELIGDAVGYICIFQFSGDAVQGFTQALETLKAQGAESLVIDLRNNPGGILDDVVQIADQLLPEGVIVYTKDREGSRQDYYSDAACCDLPLVVLVNGQSASASEILAAAVQDHGRGAVLGEQTYGKGIVQSVITFESDGAGMQYTAACYFTPSGKDIHGVGVTPDVLIAPQEDFSNYSGVPDLENDVQLREAVKLLEAE